MKKYLSIISIISILLNLNAYAVSLDEYNQLNDSSKIELFNLYADTKLFDKVDYTDLIVYGLNDNELIIRKNASQSAALYYQILQNLSANNNRIREINLENTNKIFGFAIINASNQDAEIRGSSRNIIISLTSPSEISEIYLLQHYISEEDVELRKVLIESMISAGYNSEKFKLFVKNRIAEATDEELRFLARAVEVLRIKSAIPNLSNKLEAAKKSTISILSALGSFGSDAATARDEITKILDDPASIHHSHAASALDKINENYVYESDSIIPYKYILKEEHVEDQLKNNLQRVDGSIETPQRKVSSNQNQIDPNSGNNEYIPSITTKHIAIVVLCIIFILLVALVFRSRRK